MVAQKVICNRPAMRADSKIPDIDLMAELEQFVQQEESMTLVEFSCKAPSGKDKQPLVPVPVPATSSPVPLTSSRLVKRRHECPPITPKEAKLQKKVMELEIDLELTKQSRMATAMEAARQLNSQKDHLRATLSEHQCLLKQKQEAEAARARAELQIQAAEAQAAWERQVCGAEQRGRIGALKAAAMERNISEAAKACLQIHRN
jgi:hypothetical protein